jgi:pyruvate formate-lyase activating enzyme-like uncharacterized protein
MTYVALVATFDDATSTIIVYTNTHTIQRISEMSRDLNHNHMKFRSPSLLVQDSTTRSVSVKRGHVTFGHVRIHPPPPMSDTATNSASQHPNNDPSCINIDEYEIMKLNRKSFTVPPMMKNKSKSSSQKSHSLQRRRRRQPNHHMLFPLCSANKDDEIQTIARKIQNTQPNHSHHYHHIEELIKLMDCESKTTFATATATLPTATATDIEEHTSASDLHGAVVQILIIDKLQKRYQAKEKKLNTKSSIHFNDTHSQNARSA